MKGVADQVKVRATCPRCTGEGWILLAHCALCAQEIPPGDDWWEEEGAHLPCGHDEAAYLVEQVGRCPHCRGSGQVVQWIGREAYAARRRRQMLRGLLLLLGALIPVAAVVIAMITSPPEMLCGRWWYGVTLLLLALRFVAI